MSFKLHGIVFLFLGVVLAWQISWHAFNAFTPSHAEDERSSTEHKGVGRFMGDLHPIIKPIVVYPRRAESKGIEGFVDLQFDIDEQGRPENLRVLHSEPEDTFVRSAISSSRSWTFDELNRTAVKARITYRLEWQDPRA